MSKAEAGPSGKDAPPLDHGRFVREGPQKQFMEPRLLHLIRKKPGYGYQLIEEMERLPFPGPDPDSAAVYRMLRDLERRGMVRSEWLAGESGPSKRMYYITPEGRKRLEAWVEAFRERVRMLNDFIAACGEGGV